jgi:hypothetical protein
MADRVKNAWQQGVLNATSVGFIPKETEPMPGGRGYQFVKSELLEFSIVAVPANAEAVRQLKGLGLWRKDMPDDVMDCVKAAHGHLERAMNLMGDPVEPTETSAGLASRKSVDDVVLELADGDGVLEVSGWDPLPDQSARISTSTSAT